MKRRMLLPALAGVAGLVLGFVVAIKLLEDDDGLHVGTPGPSLQIAFTGNHHWRDEHDDDIRVLDFDGFQTTIVKDAAHPAWSPDGRHIVFERKTADVNGEDVEQDDIWIVDADGTGERRLTHHPQEDHEPAWSPDGSKILFVSRRAGTPDVYVMNADGSALTRLTRNEAEDRDPAWSPDGQTVALTRNGAIWTIGADGARPRRLANSTSRSFSEPAWSPDGRSIAFVSGDSRASEIWIMRADGSARTPLTSDPPGIKDQRDDEPDWSPDGRWIVFERSASIGCGCQDGIWLMDAHGRNLHQVTEGDDTDPKWRPHSRRKP